jgi:hypothetical protein
MIVFIGFLLAVPPLLRMRLSKAVHSVKDSLVLNIIPCFKCKYSFAKSILNAAGAAENGQKIKNGGGGRRTPDLVFDPTLAFTGIFPRTYI